MLHQLKTESQNITNFVIFFFRFFLPSWVSVARRLVKPSMLWSRTWTQSREPWNKCAGDDAYGADADDHDDNYMIWLMHKRKCSDMKLFKSHSWESYPIHCNVNWHQVYVMDHGFRKWMYLFTIHNGLVLDILVCN